jgi:hypothetical protein
MLDHTQESREAFGIPDKILERAAYGGVLFALVVFGIFKDLLG